LTEPRPDRRTTFEAALRVIERVGNRLPDPVLLFVGLLVTTWGASWLLSSMSFAVVDPRTKAPLVVHDQLTGTAMAHFLANMVPVFVGFPPLGLVLVALLGMGVAEQAGLIQAGLKAALSGIAPRLLTPMVILVGLLSHTASDAGLLVIPLAGALFHAAGRHPLAGICAGFASVSGGLAANVIPSAIDPLLTGLTTAAAQIVDPAYVVNPLASWYVNSAGFFLLVPLGWYVTDHIVAPQLASTPVDGEPADPIGPLTPTEGRALRAAAVVFVLSVLGVVAWAIPADSALRAPDGQLGTAAAPLIKAIVPLIFLFAIGPGVTYGVVAGTLRSHRDVVAGMTRSMASMGYYLVMAFTASQFIAAFAQSNLGALLALEGAAALQAANTPAPVTVVGVMVLTNSINVLIASASAKWALLGPVFVPMLMQLGISPELTLAAYRIADSTSNSVTPMNPYFPLVVVFCQRWVKGAGLGTLLSLMVPYWVVFSVAWAGFLLLYWATGLPLGVDAGYTYP
jgi:aminobenzoyl-glutamate transport protein